jgi:hypothetical protein
LGDVEYAGGYVGCHRHAPTVYAVGADDDWIFDAGSRRLSVAVRRSRPDAKHSVQYASPSPGR